MPRPLLEFDRSCNDDPWYDAPRSYHDEGEPHSEGSYRVSDRRHYDDDSYYGHFRRNTSPPRNVRQVWYS